MVRLKMLLYMSAFLVICGNFVPWWYDNFQLFSPPFSNVDIAGTISILGQNWGPPFLIWGIAALAILTWITRALMKPPRAHPVWLLLCWLSIALILAFGPVWQLVYFFIQPVRSLREFSSDVFGLRMMDIYIEVASIALLWISCQP